MEEFKLSKFVREGSKLLRDVTEEFQRLGIDTSRLPKTFPDDSGKIKLVFVGQYSAGKSSLIKMLTGEDVKIGAAITTDKSTPYDWNGLEIIDTPGIDTELRPDHDAITYEQINRAALLVFVITNEGLSQRMGEHFRTLAIEQKHAANMVLVVNKMGRTALGNVPEQQEIICADLRKVTTPYDPKDLFLSFTDAESYLKAEQEKDERRRARFVSRSGREAFIDNLNRFAAQKGFLQKINLPLNMLADNLRSVLKVGGQSNAVVVFKETFEHRKDLVAEGKQQCQREIRDLLNRFRQAVAKIGRDAADAVINSGNREAAEALIKEANDRVAVAVQSCSNRINECMTLSFSDVGESVAKYESSALVQQVNQSMTQQVKEEISLGRVLPGGALAALGVLTAQIGAEVAAPFAVVATRTITQVVPTQFNAVFGRLVDIGVTALLSFEGVPLAGAKAAGSLLGEGAESLELFTTTITKTVPLPPTATNKIAQFVLTNAGKIGAVIGLLGVAWTIYSLYEGNKAQREAELKQRQVREQIIAKFNELGETAAAQMFSQSQQWLGANVDPMLKNFDAAVKQIEDDRRKSQAAQKNLSELLTRTENLIGAIQACT